MKKIITPSLALSFLFLAACAGRTERKYDKKEMEIQKQEAIEMIKKSDDIKIDRGIGKDKIIIND
jgi:hypothetical protein